MRSVLLSDHDIKRIQSLMPAEKAEINVRMEGAPSEPINPWNLSHLEFLVLVAKLQRLAGPNRCYCIATVTESNTPYQVYPRISVSLKKSCS